MRECYYMKKCERCNQKHDGFYGSGRFCSQKCARSSATRNDKNYKKKALCKYCNKEMWIDKRASVNNSVCSVCNKVKSKRYPSKLPEYRKEKRKRIRYCQKCNAILEHNQKKWCINCFHKLTRKTKTIRVQTCDVCGNNYTNRHMTKTCSKECKSILLSKTRKQQIADGKISSFGGRCKKIWYKSSMAGRISCDGSWELAFAKWCDEHKIPFKRNRIGFKYWRSDKNREANYFPDFVIGDLYIEVKGYETELDREKWSQFPFQLLVLRKKQIKLLETTCSLDQLLLHSK